MAIPFVKYQGAGNDFIMIDDREDRFEALLDERRIESLCHRRFGIGADGLILLKTSETLDFRMKYYNSDGRPSTFCGNGGRCIARFAQHIGIVSEKCHFEATDKPHRALFEGSDVVLEMHPLMDSFRKLREHDFYMHTGSPHMVRFLTEDIATYPVVEEGRRIRYSEEFAPAGVNVNFVSGWREGRLSVRTYERGVEDETLSCGTGVTACALVWYLNQLPKNRQQRMDIGITTPGGKLSVRVDPGHVWLAGPAERVFEGLIA
ncbi:MAG: diaminopimelate epimerase [Bacteroidetes bacterium]|nr:MAG: diaminopimelate epimerase [Bacteroidota bacterium]